VIGAKGQNMLHVFMFYVYVERKKKREDCEIGQHVYFTLFNKYVQQQQQQQHT
jgi:hypothetical protein